MIFEGYTYVIGLVYLILILFSIYRKTKLQFAQNARLSLLILIYHLLLGTLHLYIHGRDYGISDSHAYYLQGEKYAQLLMQDPHRFMTIFFRPNIGTYPELEYADVFISSLHWTNNGSFFICKLNTIFYFFSCGNIYTHALFFAVIHYLGILWLYNFFSTYFPIKKSMILILLAFLPSFNFWGVAIHKECLMIFFIGLIVLFGNKYYLIGVKKYLLFAFVGWLLLFYIRAYVGAVFIFALLPLLFLSFFKNAFSLLKYVFILFLEMCAGIFVFPFIMKKTWWQWISDMQDEFIRNGGYTRLLEHPIDPNFISAMHYMPIALRNIFLKPSWSDCHKFSLYIAYIDDLVVLLLIAILIFNMDFRKWSNQISITLFTFSISWLIFLGYTVTYFAILTRYKSIPIGLLLLSLLLLTRDNFGKNIFHRKSTY